MKSSQLFFSSVGVCLIGLAVYLFSLPAGHATVGEVRAVAGLCGMLAGIGVALIVLQMMRGFYR